MRSEGRRGARGASPSIHVDHGGADVGVAGDGSRPPAVSGRRDGLVPATQERLRDCGADLLGSLDVAPKRESSRTSPDQSRTRARPRQPREPFRTDTAPRAWRRLLPSHPVLQPVPSLVPHFAEVTSPQSTRDAGGDRSGMMFLDIRWLSVLRLAETQRVPGSSPGGGASRLVRGPLRAAGGFPGPHLFPTLSRRKEAPHPVTQVRGFDVSGVGGEVAMAGHGRCDVVLQHIDHVEEVHP